MDMDTVKLIIEIPKELYENKKGYLTNMDAYMICKAVQNGTPLDSVKAEMQKVRCFHVGTFEDDNPIDNGIVEGIDKAIGILDNIEPRKSEDKGMTFKVIDTLTGKEPTSSVIVSIAKKGGLMEMDIDQFYVGENGALVLADDCGNITYCDMRRFKVMTESEGT